MKIMLQTKREDMCFHCLPLVFGLNPDLTSDIEAVVGSALFLAAPLIQVKTSNKQKNTESHGCLRHSAAEGLEAGASVKSRVMKSFATKISIVNQNVYIPSSEISFQTG